MEKIKDFGNGLFLGFYYKEFESDYSISVTNWVKLNKPNIRKFNAYKYQNECDFCHTDYDCNGSEKVTIKIQRRGRYIRLIIKTQKDY